MKLKAFYCILLIGLSFVNLKGQSVLTITDQAMGNPGSADVILSQAETLANSGQTVTVNMNAAGFCNMGSTISLMLSQGAIIIRKDPTATVDQGFAFSSFAGTDGIDIFCDSTVDLSFRNISFQNMAVAITSFGGRRFICDSVKTLAVATLVYLDDNTVTNDSNNVTKSILIQNGEYDETGVGIGYAGPIITRQNSYKNGKPKHINILNNNFKSAGNNVFIGSQATFDRLLIEIKNNQSSLGRWSSSIGGYQYYTTGPVTYAHQNNDYLFNLDFENNTDVISLALTSPLNYWKVSNNVFNYKTGGAQQLLITPSYSTGTTPAQYSSYKLGVINTSVTPYCNNQSFLNGNNTFMFHSTYPLVGGPPLYTSFSINGNGSPGCAVTEVTDLNLPGAIGISQNVSVRTCSIFSSVSPNQPILNFTSPISATINPIVISGGNLNASYTYTGITNANNNDLYVDFYKSNTNGDLVNYLGYQYFAVGSVNGSGSATLPIPGTVTLTPTDRVAATFTGLHPSGSTTVVAMGTSPAFYAQPPCPTLTSFTTTNTGKCLEFAFTGILSGLPTGSCVTASFDWGDGSTPTVNTVCSSTVGSVHTYSLSVPYTATLTVTGPGTCIATATVAVPALCPLFPCSDCISSFAPLPGKKYLVSAWTKEKNAPQAVTSYTNAYLQITYPSIAASTGSFVGSGTIIDGWQRIEGIFTIPVTATDMGVKLDCISGDCYFDDIRLFPFDGSMKSYVYDPVNKRLVAELDERNYATLYEYDEDGKLIRVKKETEKGKMTIQENRNNTKK